MVPQSDYSNDYEYEMINPDYSDNLHRDKNISTESNKPIIAFGVIGVLLIILVVGGYITRHKIIAIYKSKSESSSVPVL